MKMSQLNVCQKVARETLVAAMKVFGLCHFSWRNLFLLFFSILVNVHIANSQQAMSMHGSSAADSAFAVSVPFAMRFVLFSSDDRYIIVNDAASVRVYDLSDRSLVAEFDLPNFVSRQVFMAPDDRFLLSGGPDSLRVWSWRTGEYLWSIPGRNGGAAYLGQSGLLETDDRRFAIVSTLDGQKQKDLSVTGKRHVFYHFDSSGNRVVTLDTSGAVRVYDLMNGQTLFSKTDRSYNGCRISRDGKSVACIRSTGLPVLYGVDSGDTVVSLQSSMQFRNRDIAFDPTGTLVATIGKDTGTFDSHVRVWDAKTGALFAYLGRHGVESRYIVYSPSGAWIATLSDDSTVRIWPAPKRPSSVRRLTSVRNTMNVNAFPDPARDRTTVEYTLERTASAQLRLVNAMGTDVLSMNEPQREPGTYRVSLDVSSLPSGMYFVVVTAGAEQSVRPLRVAR